MINYLITGGAGYLGSHLIKELLKRGGKVKVLDIERTKYIDRVKDQLDFFCTDIRNYNAVKEVMNKVDIVFHLAFIQMYSKLPRKAEKEINVNGTKNILRAAIEAGVKRLIFSSTIEIYGPRPPVPCNEDAPIDLWDSYSEDKYECEKLCLEAHKKYGLKVTILRTPNICGPGHYAEKEFLDIADKILAGKNIFWIGKGNRVGDVVHYKDVIDAYILASEKNEAIGEIFNISSEEKATHKELLQACINHVNNKSKIIPINEKLARIFLKLRKRSSPNYIPQKRIEYITHDCIFSIEKAKRLLGYRPKRSMKEAVIAQLDGYRKDMAFIRQRRLEK